MINKILNKKEALDKQDIVSLLNISDENELIYVLEKANEVRRNYCGNEVHLRGIIEFSNYCEQDCLYCGLRSSNKFLSRYRMTREEILQTCEKIYKAGIKTIVLQSGEDFYFTTDEITDIIKSIKAEFNSAITLSLGEREFNEYKEWKDAGADRYLLKHETANERLYSKYHLGQNLIERIEHLKNLKSLGYQIGSGNLIGLPNQTLEDIADDILLCRELDVDMASFSPFIPSPNTPYRNHKHADFNLTLLVMSVARIVLQNVHIPATTALATLDNNGWERGLAAGANVIMPNFTPQNYKEQYRIYPHKNNINDNPFNFKDYLEGILAIQNRIIAKDFGHSLKPKVLL